VDLAEIWLRMHEYVCDDFTPIIALRRLQMFTKYFSLNFKFGHQFKVDLLQASSLEEIRARAEAFFAGSPVTIAEPKLAAL
jgi:hypothetical protein